MRFKTVDNIAGIVRRPFVKMLPVIFARNCLEIVLCLDSCLAFGLFLRFAGIAASRERLTSMEMEFSRLSKPNVGEGTKRQKFLFARKAIFVSPPFAPIWLNQQKKTATVG